MSLCPSSEQLHDLLSDRLTAVAEGTLLAHVEDCTLCQEALESLTTAPLSEVSTAVFPTSADQANPTFWTRVKSTSGASGLAIDRHRNSLPHNGANAGEATCPLHVGPYDVIRELGRGGMGVVYLAEQPGLKRPVALKVVRAGIQADAADLARFRQEAAAAARLRHPHIVQVYEVGEADGVAYLALEYVDGVSLQQHQSGRPLEPRAAARLTEALARALAHAHHHGVIHRDVKPANVLLQREESPRRTGECEDAEPGASPSPSVTGPSALHPKLTDFGLAKRLDGSVCVTQSGTAVGTPSYMAPEQALGRSADIGPAVDVYGLGATLYELLTGRPPFQGPTTLATLRQVTDREPVPPRHLQPTVPRDLETICLKCLHKEPTGRYAAANDLAADLRRFLGGEPIQARRSGSLERSWKWARRRPALAGLVAVSGLAILGFLVGGLVHDLQMTAALRETEAARGRADNERERAEDTLRTALRAMDDICFRVLEDHIPRDPEMERQQRELLTKALAFYADFTQSNPQSAPLRLELGMAVRRMGNIQFQQGHHDAAEGSYKRAIELLGQSAETFADEPEHRAALALSLDSLGTLLGTIGRQREAEPFFTRGRGVLQELVNQYPQTPSYARELAGVETNLARLLRDTNRPDEADPLFRQALQSLRSLAAASPNVEAYQESLANCLNDLARLLSGRQRFSDAEPLFAESLNIARRLADGRGDNARYQRYLGRSYHNLGNAMRNTDRAEDAVVLLRRALEVRQQLATQFATVPELRRDVAASYLVLGSVLKHLKRAEQAEDALRQAEAYLRRLTDEYPQITDYHNTFASTLRSLAELLRDRGEPAEALSLLDSAVHRQQRALKANPRNATYARNLREHYWAIAETHRSLDDHRAMDQIAAKLIEITPDDWENAHCAAMIMQQARSVAARMSNLPAHETSELMRTYDARVFQHYTKALQQNPDEPALWLQRGRCFTISNNWPRAAADYATAVKLRPDDWETVCESAAVALLAGEQDQYRQVCQSVLRQAGTRLEHRSAYLAALIGCLGPCEAAQASECVRLADIAIAAGPRAGWYLYADGLAHYRAGSYEQAISRLRQSLAGSWKPTERPVAWLVLTLAHHRLGQAQQARECFEKATQWHDRTTKEIESMPLGQFPTVHPHIWFSSQLLRREAEQLLSDGVP